MASPIHTVAQRGGAGAAAPGAAARPEVVSASFGANCTPTPADVTDHLARSCNGKARCQYTVDHQVIGDPKRACTKSYVARWRCGSDATIHQVEVLETKQPPYTAITELACPEHRLGSIARSLFSRRRDARPMNSNSSGATAGTRAALPVRPMEQPERDSVSWIEGSLPLVLGAGPLDGEPPSGWGWTGG